MQMKTILKLIRKAFAFVLILGIIGCAVLVLVNAYIVESSKDRIITQEEAADIDADCILVLGAGVYNGTPTPMLNDRLLQGIALYETGASDRLLMSGDHGRKEYDEVNVMKQYAIDAGVSSEKVFMDHAGFSTYESLYRARDIFQAKKIIIVTQKYHLYRALYTAKALGLDAYGVSADPRQYAGQTYREAREILARAKDFLYTLAKPKPTYLGDAIPVQGNGDLTND
jgi:vancomycin permeability regulator SanA